MEISSLLTDKANQNILFLNVPALINKSILKISKIFFALIVLIFYSCNLLTTQSEADIDYKQEMRDFVKELSNYSKSIKSDFIIIPQNGVELLIQNSEENGSPNSEYIIVILATVNLMVLMLIFQLVSSRRQILPI